MKIRTPVDKPTDFVLPTRREVRHSATWRSLKPGRRVHVPGPAASRKGG